MSKRKLIYKYNVIIDTDSELADFLLQKSIDEFTAHIPDYIKQLATGKEKIKVKLDKKIEK